MRNPVKGHMAERRLDRLLPEHLLGENLIGSPADGSPISPLMAIPLQSPPREMLNATPVQPENFPITDITSDEQGRNATNHRRCCRCEITQSRGSRFDPKAIDF